ncbi:MAG: hypothetical protein IJA97_01945 [Clostridia bacterium]|nr:hypothetical protein [Clostridia bacterium]
MEQFAVYKFFLSLIVFVVLTVIFTAFVVYVIKVSRRIIKSGMDDEKIKIEYEKKIARKSSIICTIFEKLVLILCCAFVLIAFAFAVYVTVREDKVVTDIPTLKVVQSDSMSFVNEKNRYVKAENVKENIDVFDLVVIDRLPKEEDLKVNDIVLYETNGIYVIHRIVAIEEVNEKHPEGRHFLLHGDANEVADRFPVTYKQMRGVYNGARVPFVGSFVMFMQSPAGWLCALLVLFAIIALPIAEKKTEREKYARLVAMGIITEAEESSEAVKPEPQVATEQQGSAEAVKLEQKEEKAEKGEIIPLSHGEHEETAVTLDEVEISNAHSIGALFAMFNAPKSFKEKLSLAGEELNAEYNEIVSTLCRIERVRAIRGFKGETYRCGNKGVCKLTIRGKTLNVYLALEPNEFKDTKYIYEDVSDKKDYANYPMRVKITSNRQVRWARELILLLCEKNGFKVAKEPITNISDLFSTFKKSKSFTYKLRTANDVLKGRYKDITSFIKSIDRVRVIRGFKGETYKRGNLCVCKLAIRGKTLNAYIGLDPKKFENTKYKYIDVSSSKAYANYPMRVKVTSDRQVRWAKELISACINGGEL